MPTRDSLEREWLIVGDGETMAAMCPVCGELYSIKAIYTIDICPECHTHMTVLSNKRSRNEQHRSLSSSD